VVDVQRRRIDTGWRRCIGCLKFQVSFRKRATNYRALSQEMTYKDNASYASSPPCTTTRTHTHNKAHCNTSKDLRGRFSHTPQCPYIAPSLSLSLSLSLPSDFATYLFCIVGIYQKRPNHTSQKRPKKTKRDLSQGPNHLSSARKSLYEAFTKRPTMTRNAFFRTSSMRWLRLVGSLKT